jgi:hypothetical protein
LKELCNEKRLFREEKKKGHERTSVGSVPRSVVIPRCSLFFSPFGQARRNDESEDAPRNGEKVVPVYALVIPNLIVCTYATRKDHDASLLISSWVEKVVALGTEVEGRLSLMWVTLTNRGDDD